MKLDKFSMFEAVQGIPDVRHIVAIMFGSTDLKFIKAVLEKSGYPFGTPERWGKQLREVHGEWLTKGKTLEGIKTYLGMADPFNMLEKRMKYESLKPGWYKGLYWSGQYWYTKPHYRGNTKGHQRFIGTGYTPEDAIWDLDKQLR